MNLAKIIESSRFKNKKAAIEYVTFLKNKFSSAIVAPKIVEYASASPDPDLALRSFVKVADIIGNIGEISGSEKELIWCLGASEYLGKIIMKYPDLISILKPGRLATIKSKDEQLKELLEEVSTEKDIENFMSIIRRYRDKEYFRIGMVDLLRKSEMKTVTEQLSGLASACLEIALNFADSTIRGLDFSFESKPDFVIIGMGKLGGNELNFLSDIDLLYLSEDKGVTPLPYGLTWNEYSTKLATLVTKLVGSVTEDGFAFRIDLRLRPDGNAGPIVTTVSAAIDYYTQWGETWERAALIKATPVAGNMKLGERFLQEVTPFVYRRYLDYTTVEDLKELKRKIEINMRKNLTTSWNCKTGEGGIRSIEFLVQTLQLINGGKNKKIRKANTLEAIESLRNEGFLGFEEAENLKEAYIFLRDLEHRIQIYDGRRGHTLPEDDELIQLARRTGFYGDDREVVQQFMNVLNKHRNLVNDIFSNLFYKEERESKTKQTFFVDIVMNEETKKETIIEEFRKSGFVKPEKGYEILMELKEEPIKKRFSSRAKTIFDKLLPEMISEIIKSSDPDSALLFLSKFLNKVGGRIVPYYQLAENKETLRYLISLFANSEYLSKFLINHPELIDYLILKAYAAPIKTKSTMAAELDKFLSEAHDYEETMDILRRFRNTEILRIASNNLYGEISLKEVSEQFTSLAEIMLNKCLKIASESLQGKYGTPEDSRFAVIGLGKLGGKELGYNSDLDIIFIYSDEGNTKGGKKSITNREYYTYLAQRIISLLTTYTTEGYIFKVDTRLRPSGNAGAMVISLDAFKEYHSVSAWLWERQAMLKSRAVAGDEVFGKEVEKVIKEIVFTKGLSPEDKKEMHKMRLKIISEHQPKNKMNLKYSPGGLIDIEFLVQGLQLEYGRGREKLQNPNTFDVITALVSENIVSKDTGNTLLEAYKFLRLLENHLRLVYDYSHDNLPEDEYGLKKLSKGLGLINEQSNKSKLVEIYLYWTKKVIMLYNNYFE